jgi:thioesterase domain-containing protein
VRRRPDQPRPLASRLAGSGPADVCIVHPGALPRSAWGPLAAEFAGESVWLLELDAVEEYRDAALGGSCPTLSVEDLADRLSAELLRIGTAERLVLVGWSFGGVVAYAMAQREVQSSRRVVLLDSIAPVDDYRRPNDALSTDLLLEWFAMYLGARGPARLRACTPAGESLETGLERVRAAAIEAGAVGPGTASAGLRKLFDTYVAGLRRNNDLAGPHRPGPTRRPLTLIKARHSLLEDPDLGWSQLAAVEVVESPGDHYTMVSQGLAFPQLTAVLRGALAPSLV